MSRRIAFTPPRLSPRETAVVRRRVLLYLHGYDPDAERRYRTLFVRELRLYAKRFGIVPPRVSRPSLSADGHMQTWTVDAEGSADRTVTTYAVLLWHDLVRRDMDRPYLLGAWLNAVAFLHVAASGALFRMYRASWKCGNVIVFPFVMTLLPMAAALGAAAIGHALLGAGGAFATMLTLACGTAAGLLGLRVAIPLLEWTFLWQLMNDWVFNWQHARGRRPDYRERLDRFADLASAEIGAGGVDEVVLVGHSSGALVAVELAQRLLARDAALGREGPILSLLTLGSSLPIVAMQPQAREARAAIRGVLTSQRLVWADYQAPQDWMNFPGFRPAEDLGLDLPPDQAANPVIRSARFREILDAQTYDRIKTHPFRMHFQFLMANDFPGVFDIFALTLGDRCLRSRVLSEDADPLPSRRQHQPSGPCAGLPDLEATEPLAR